MGDLKYPLVSDIKREISQKYQVLNSDGVALRGLFVIDKEVPPLLHLATASSGAPIISMQLPCM